MTWEIRLRVMLGNILLFGLLFGFISLNKEILRPSFNHIPIVNQTLGCLPNFIAAYLIGLFFVNGALTIKPTHSRLIVSLGSLFVFVVLTIEELNPMWGASSRFDVLDIIASGAGSLLAVFSFEIGIALNNRGSVSTKT